MTPTCSGAVNSGTNGTRMKPSESGVGLPRSAVAVIVDDPETYTLRE
jgi:hypothetical protein